MSAELSHNPSLIEPIALPGCAGVGRRFDLARRFVAHRATLASYGQLLAGTGGRLVLQVVYFFVLANTLSLAEMGVFASISATGLLIGCFAGFGFSSFVMRSAAGRRSSLAAYLGAYYLCFALALPLMFGVALVLYWALFSHVITLPGYLTIILVEVTFWRQIEMLLQVNNGLGHFARASTLVSLPVAFRAIAALLFWYSGGGHAETWAVYYLVGNAIAAVLLTIVFHPRIRPRLKLRLVRGRLVDGLLYASSYCMFLAQSEIDKLVILSLGGERMAGIYAISMRLIDLTGVPLRPLFMMYSRKLIQAGRASRTLLAECLKIEGVVAAVSTAGLLALVALLHLWPGILGNNVSTAYEMLVVVIAVPAVKNLLEFHGELFFAFDRMGLRAAVTATLVCVKALGVALLVTTVTAPHAWGLWLNVVFALAYAISFATVYGVIAGSIPRGAVK